MLTLADDQDLARVRVIASDMDFTLLADDGSMPEHMPERITALDEAGVTFVAASGRPTYTLQAMFSESLERMATLSDNGATIMCRGELVCTSLIAPKSYQELIRCTFEEGGGFPVLCALDRAVIAASARPYDAYLRTFYHDIDYVETFEGIEVDANKYTIYYPNGGSRHAFAEVFGPRFSDTFSVTTAGDMWVDVMNQGIDKGFGIRELCAYVGVDTSDALALGDNYNDAQMLQEVGHGYVMANAAAPIRAFGRYVAPSNNERGVAQVIDAVLAAKGVPFMC